MRRFNLNSCTVAVFTLPGRYVSTGVANFQAVSLNSLALFRNWIGTYLRWYVDEKRMSGRFGLVIAVVDWLFFLEEVRDRRSTNDF